MWRFRRFSTWTKLWTVYHAAENKFERFREVLELISRFEFDFRRCGNILFERFEYLMCSKFSHIQRECTCAYAVACLCPHNSISNVVASVTIHDDKYLYIFRKDVAKKKYLKPLGKVEDPLNRTSWKVSDVRIVRDTLVLSVSLSLCLSVSLSLCLCVCVSVSVCCVLLWCSWLWLWWWWKEERRREVERRRGETNRTTWAKVSLKIAETEQPYQVRRMIGGIGEFLFGEPLKHVTTKHGQILVSRTLLSPVCRFNTSPCVRSKRPRVYRQHAYTCFNMRAWCRYTRGRIECTHGAVLNLHTGFSAFFQRAATHTKTHTHTHQTHTTATNNTTTTTTHATQHNTAHNTTRRQRQRETEKEDRDRERQRKRDKTRQDKTRQDKREKIKDNRREDREKRREKTRREREEARQEKRQDEEERERR